MKSGFVQRRFDRNPGLEPRALLPSPPQLTRDHGVEFELAFDDLGPYVFATGFFDGQPIAFDHHVHSREPGTYLWANDDATAERVISAWGYAPTWRRETS